MTARPSRRTLLVGGGALAVGALAGPGSAWAEKSRPPDEDGYQLWLRYRLVDDDRLLAAYRAAFTHVVAPGRSVLRSARTELTGALSALLGRRIAAATRPNGDGALIVGTPRSSPWIARHVDRATLRRLGPEGYVIRRGKRDGAGCVFVASEGETGVLYGAFHLLRLLQTQRDVRVLDVAERPVNELRLANHWDNLDRSVERGYSGPSIFRWDELPHLRHRYTDYARALASVGMNGAVVNNVNANAQFLSSDMLDGLAALAGALREWGVTLHLSADFASPIELGGLDTADPFDPEVQAWWRAKADEIYRMIPDFGGYLVKANSEGQPGPLDYGRTHADGANMLADSVRRHGGIVMWRAFIHDFDPKTWAHRSYETFRPLDGQFADNAILQIKNGPIDFQVREPVHPLFGALPRTNSMMELQITQEYTGHATHLCYQVPWWKQVYDFDTYGTGRRTTVARVVDGSAYGYSHSGVAGVMNFGAARDWTGHQLAAANTHGYGRLAWNPALEPEAVADEWTRMTFGCDPQVVKAITTMLLESHDTYEHYTSPLGCGFMIGDPEHYQPGPAGNQPWHRADAEGIGFDRTQATGDGDTAMWRPPVSAVFESLERCPDVLLLFFHHVPWDYRLDSGRTVIQYIYDTHFSGHDDVLAMRANWRSLRRRIDALRYADTLDRFDRQVDDSRVWRDTLVAYFFETCRLLDARREWLQVRLDRVPVLLSGVPTRVQITAGNATGRDATLTARLATPEDWTSGSDRVTLASREFGGVTVPVRATARPPGLFPLSAVGSSGRRDVLTGTAADVQVLVAPPGRLCVLALDAGNTSGPVQATYRRLLPTDAWDADRGYGWVDGVPESRDRGDQYDDLSRDFTNDTTPRTLRVAVPAGEHDAYLLVGDNTGLYPTYVRSGGDLLAQSERMIHGGWVWLHLSLDGGASGRDVDLELSSDPGQHWHLNALAVVDPDAQLPPAVLGDTSAPAPLLGGRANTLTVQAANTTSAALDVTATAEVPDGWSASTGSRTVPAGDVGPVALTLTPPAGPTTATVTVRLSASGGSDTGVVSLDVAPAGDRVHLALDAGPDGSPVLDTYTRLAPEDGWDAARGYGWVGSGPSSRDRGSGVDVLRRDFVNDTTARVLRVTVPAGEHDVYALVGDTFDLKATRISAGGAALAEAPAAPGGTFTWLHFTLAGGTSGTDVDLEIAGDAGENWHLNALVLR